MHDRCRRNSLRYPGYDYSQSGAYFVTVNTHENRHLFGTVSNSEVNLGPPGSYVSHAWCDLEQRFPGILLDEYIVMPSHIHGIIFVVTDPTIPPNGLTVGLLVNSFKNAVIAAWRKGVVDNGWPRCQGKLWHRDYYERIIRNDQELAAIREYIIGNPARWSEKHGT